MAIDRMFQVLVLGGVGLVVATVAGGALEGCGDGFDGEGPPFPDGGYPSVDAADAHIVRRDAFPLEGPDVSVIEASTKDATGADADAPDAAPSVDAGQDAPDGGDGGP